MVKETEIERPGLPNLTTGMDEFIPPDSHASGPSLPPVCQMGHPYYNGMHQCGSC